MILRIDIVVNFLGGLPDEEETAGDQNEILPGEAVAEKLEKRFGELDDPGDGAEQGKTHDESKGDTGLAGPFPMLGRQLVGEDGDEDEVVDPENHFHHHERDKRHPGSRVLNERHDILHRRISPCVTYGRGQCIVAALPGKRRKGVYENDQAFIP